MITDVIQEFCSQYGLKGISLGETGKLRLSIEGTGDLQFFNEKNKLLMGLSKKIENPYSFSARKILGMSHFKEPNFHPLHAQLKDETLGIFYLFQEDEVTSALLCQALDALADIMEKALE